MSVADLVPWDGNPRRISAPARVGLEASISRFGCVEPIVWNKRTGRVVGGHQRLDVLKAQGVEDIDVVIVDLPEVEERALNVALNNPHIAGEWTPDVRALLAELSAGFDGFKELRLDTLLDELGKKNLRDGADTGQIDEDEAVPPPEKPKTRIGDLWFLGPHRLLCGDSTDPAALSRLLDGGSADGVFTDPPYNVNYSPEERGLRRRRFDQTDELGLKTKRSASGKERRFDQTDAKRRIANDNLPADEFFDLLVRSFRSMDTVLRPGAAIYVCGPAGWEARHFWAAWPEAAWHFQSALVWDKSRFALSRWDYHPGHEIVFYGWKKGAPRTWLGKRDQGSVLEFEMGNGRAYIHPTQKPVGLVRRALLNSVPEGGTVLDLFGGSGSTLIAAETCGRRACLVELDPRFVDAAVQRWERYTGGKAKREKGR